MAPSPRNHHWFSCNITTSLSNQDWNNFSARQYAQQGALGAFELLANAVAGDLVPVYLCSSDRELTSQRLEGCVRHRLVVFANGSLVLCLWFLHELHQFFGRLSIIAKSDAFLHLLGWHKLYVAVLVVVHLDFQDSNNLRLLAGYGDSPLTSPAAVPVVLRLELMVLNTADDGLTVLRKTLVRHHHNKESFLFVCHLCWFGECGRHSMSIVVQGVGSHLRFYCCSETFHLHKPITSSIDNCEDERCQHPDIDSPQNLDSRVCSQRLLFSGDHTWTTAATWGQQTSHCQDHYGQSQVLATLSHPPERLAIRKRQWEEHKLMNFQSGV